MKGVESGSLTRNLREIRERWIDALFTDIDPEACDAGMAVEVAPGGLQPLVKGFQLRVIEHQVASNGRNSANWLPSWLMRSVTDGRPDGWTLEFLVRYVDTVTLERAAELFLTDCLRVFGYPLQRGRHELNDALLRFIKSTDEAIRVHLDVARI